MHDTFQDPKNGTHPIAIIPDLARPYAPTGSGYSDMIFIGARQISGAGALISTTTDLYVWDQALYTEKLVPKSLIDLMFTWKQGGWGYGWQDGGSFEGHPRAWHTGTLQGFISHYSRLPDVKLTMIELSNVAISGELRDQIAGGLMHLALQQTR
jgi:CubicO group peptidase (beta-lactamase class C family)